MTLQQLRYAIAVADCGSMNQAAAKLFISQPSLSEAVKELEREIGIRIFGRTNRGILVTTEGNEFLGYARQVPSDGAAIRREDTNKEALCRFHAALYLCR